MQRYWYYLLIVFSFTWLLNTASYAEEAANNVENSSVDAIEAMEEEFPNDGSMAETEEALTVILRHQVNDNAPLAEKQIQPDELILLRTLKDDIATFLEKHGKPLQVKTTLDIKISTDEVLSAVFDTQIDEKGLGVSKYELAEVNFTEDDETLVIKGWHGHFKFTETFTEIFNHSTIEHFHIIDETEDSGVAVTINQANWHIVADEFLMPQTLEVTVEDSTLNIPEELKLKFKDIAFDSKTRLTESSLEVSPSDITIAELSGFTQTTPASEAAFTLENLAFHSEAKEEGDVLNTTITTAIDNIHLSAALLGTDFPLNLAYQAKLGFNQLETEALLELQKDTKELQKQRQTGAVSEEMMSMALIGKLIQLAPQILKESPEIALTDFSLASEQRGKMQGGIALGIQGSKVGELSDFNKLIKAVTFQAKFIADKSFTEALALIAKTEGQTAESVQKDWIEKGFIVENPENYQSEMSLLEDKLSLNGKEIALFSNLVYKILD